MATETIPAPKADQADGKRTRRQFVRYAFYKARPEWRALAPDTKARAKAEFLSALEALTEGGIVRLYSTVGARADCDLFIWHVADSVDALHAGAARLNATELGRYMELAHNFLAQTKRSIYIEKHVHHGQEGARLRIRPSGKKFIFVYPFVKTRQWYLLPQEERQRMMDTHIEVGHRYPSVRLNTTYSFGLDDQEFVVAFETDEPSDFLDLVMELRGTEGSVYTLRDTPIFTCISVEPEAALDALG
jgi:chlorite dismutase